MSQDKYHLISNEPYTSELYGSLLEPAFNQVRESFVKQGIPNIPAHKIYSTLVLSALKGAYIGAIKAATKVAIHNINRDYSSQPNPKPPVDVYWFKYYTNPKRYPMMFRGLKQEIEVEVTYQSSLQIINTISKAIIPPQKVEFGGAVGLSLARSFCTNLITASTVYPTALVAFTDKEPEEIINKTIRRAGIGSIKASLRALGISVARSLLPSLTDTVTILLEIVA